MLSNYNFMICYTRKRLFTYQGYTIKKIRCIIISVYIAVFCSHKILTCYDLFLNNVLSNNSFQFVFFFYSLHHSANFPHLSSFPYGYQPFLLPGHLSHTKDRQLPLTLAKVINISIYKESIIHMLKRIF